jgi:hypothetical protein
MEVYVDFRGTVFRGGQMDPYFTAFHQRCLTKEVPVFLLSAEPEASMRCSAVPVVTEVNDDPTIRKVFIGAETVHIDLTVFDKICARSESWLEMRCLERFASYIPYESFAKLNNCLI